MARPTAAFVLILIGGILILINAVLVILLGTAVGGSQRS